jgi:hypothetical protein
MAVIFLGGGGYSAVWVEAERWAGGHAGERGRWDG